MSCPRRCARTGLHVDRHPAGTGDDPLYEDLGRGYPGSMPGFYVFTDRGGDRIERAALGIDGYMLEECGVYDIVSGPHSCLRQGAGSEADRP